jgi:hypothetical protein
MIAPELRRSTGFGIRFDRMPGAVFCRSLRRAVLVLLVSIPMIGCGESGDPVQQDRIERDAARWASANIRDYDLTWQSTSTRNHSLYRVYVRESEVRAVRMIRPDGKAIALKPADPGFYSVDGLFRTIREELAQSQEPRPFGQPPGTTVILTMRSDERLGYPTMFRRDIFGVDDRMGIDVIELKPSTADIPPPDPPR